MKEGGLALRQVISKDRNWGLFITQLITSYSGARMRYVNLNWQQILHNCISEHQSALAFAMEFSFHIIKTL